MSELRECPFCGGEVELWDNKLERRLYGVICKECDCMTPYFESEVEAIEAWNRREPIDKIVEQLEERADKANDYWVDGLTYFDGKEDGIREAIEIVKGGSE